MFEYSNILAYANHENNINDSSTINNTMNRLPSYSDILRINTNTSTSNTSNTTNAKSIQLNMVPSVVIKCISSSNRNIEFIKKLFKSIKVDPNTIKQLTFRSHFCNIILSSPCASDTLLNCRSSLAKLPIYAKLFIRPYIELSEVKLGRLFYHVYKCDLLPGYKSILNYRTNTYEIRKLITSNGISKIDWKHPEYIPTSDNLSDWEISFSSFMSNKQDTEIEPVSTNAQ